MEHYYCHGCGKDAAYHVDVALVVTSTDAPQKRKHSGIWLCAECEVKMRRLMARDVEQPERLAAALTSTPRVIYRTARA